MNKGSNTQHRSEDGSRSCACGHSETRRTGTDGQKIQRLTIHYKFIGALEILE